MNPAFSVIYDFELVPYALGDVLTWNVQTALQAQEARRHRVDAYICLDPRYPAGIYQRGLVTAENCNLFFAELFGAFATHPLLGNIHIYNEREALLERLRAIAAVDSATASVLADYEEVLSRRSDERALNDYFIKYIHSHDKLNAHHEAHGSIPLLTASRGCEPDVDTLLGLALADKRVVVIHPRLRRLDAGMAGEHTHARDSDFLEWYEFLCKARVERPDVVFVVVGRLQEKPIELLRLPNVISLRPLGLGLGHELTLLLKADLFIGTSSGFAAMANFSRTPYFVTKMSKEACFAYAIPEGATRLPFAAPHQTLVYEPESTAMLMNLLERGLTASTVRKLGTRLDRVAVTGEIGHAEHAKRLRPSATTHRYFLDNLGADRETAFLLAPIIAEAMAQRDARNGQGSEVVIARIRAAFPRLADAVMAGNTLLRRKHTPTWRKTLARWFGALNSRLLPTAVRKAPVLALARRVKRSLVSLIS